MLRRLAKAQRRSLCDDVAVDVEPVGLVVWDVDGTLIPADLRWLRRSIARTYSIKETAVVFPTKKVHGYTDESIVLDSAVESGISSDEAKAGIPRFYDVLADVMHRGMNELRRVQPPYPGAVDSIAELRRRGFVQTVLTGNLRSAAEVKIDSLGLAGELDLDVGGYGSDESDRFKLPAVVARRFEEKYGQGMPTSKTVVVGDAPNDIACARHAGFWVIAVAHRMKRDELLGFAPDAVLDDLLPAHLLPAVTSLVSR